MGYEQAPYAETVLWKYAQQLDQLIEGIEKQRDTAIDDKQHQQQQQASVVARIERGEEARFVLDLLLHGGVFPPQRGPQADLQRVEQELERLHRDLARIQESIATLDRTEAELRSTIARLRKIRSSLGTSGG